MPLRTHNCSLSECWIFFKLKNEDMSLMEEEMTVPLDSCMRQAEEFVTLTALLMLCCGCYCWVYFPFYFFQDQSPGPSVSSPRLMLQWSWRLPASSLSKKKKHPHTLLFVSLLPHPPLSHAHTRGLWSVTNLRDSWDLPFKWNGLLSESSSTLQRNFSYNCSLLSSIRK